MHEVAHNIGLGHSFENGEEYLMFGCSEEETAFNVSQFRLTFGYAEKFERHIRNRKRSPHPSFDAKSGFQRHFQIDVQPVSHKYSSNIPTSTCFILALYGWYRFLWYHTINVRSERRI